MFSAKASVLRGARFVSDLTQPVRRFRHGMQADYPILLAECRSPLWTAESMVERSLQLGKVQNLRKACARLHLAEVPAGETFSFWKQIGKAKRSAGYVRGRELRQGCLIASVGGGLCQLSNTLYDLALKCGFEIVERHAHTSVVAGSAAEQGRDATIFWNYVDLRFRPEQVVLFTAVLSKDEVIVSCWGKQGLVPIDNHKPAARQSSSVNTCTDCGVTECFRHVESTMADAKTGVSAGHTDFPSAGHRAFLIEECWPEFETFVAQTRTASDELFLPFHSNVWKQPRYQWTSNGFSRVVAANFQTALATLSSRLGPSKKLTPIARQLQRSQDLADYYGGRLSISASNIYVAQSLLPFLWRQGDLGGRSFSVLMTRLPLYALHKKLDDLVLKFPERKTFQEFRAPAWMLDAEAEALEQADRIITPHIAFARLFPLKTVWLDWKLPAVKRGSRGSCIVFPGPSLARKGAYELLDAVRGLDSSLLVLNAQTVESTQFWSGVQLADASGDWLHQAAVVVQPAFIENNPRPLLRALAAGVPVIATPECGIEAHPLLTLVPPGDAEALRDAIRNTISPSQPSPVIENVL